MRTRAGVTCGALALLAGLAQAQDSVATTPGGNDAIPAYDTAQQRQLYVLDLVPIETSWGNRVAVGSLLKATREIDPAFRTSILQTSALSSGHIEQLQFEQGYDYRLWGSAGPGVHATANSPAGLLSVSGYDRQFGAAFCDLAIDPGAAFQPSQATTIVAAIVGQNVGTEEDLLRLYVERTNALVSRAQEPPDTATLALATVTPAGVASVKAEDFNTSPAFPVRVRGETAVRLSGPRRSLGPGTLGLNVLANIGSGNLGVLTDLGATTAVIDGGTTTITPPVSVSRLFGAPPFNPRDANLFSDTDFGTSIVLDFSSKLTIGRTTTSRTTTSAHLAPGVRAGRGGLSYSVTAAGGGAAGTAAHLAIRTGQGEVVDTLNAFGLAYGPGPIDPLGVAAGTARSATLPSPITDGAGFTANTGGQARFEQYLSQASLRGPSGLVGVGQTQAGELVLAAVARESGTGEFIAVATLPTGGGGAAWTVAARVGSEVMDGPPASSTAEPGGQRIGEIVGGEVVTFSAPAVDLWGNVFFAATWREDGEGTDKVGVFRAVRIGSGYVLEALLSEGQDFVGGNSATPATVRAIRLADRDSIAAGTVHAGSLLQRPPAGFSAADPTEMFTFGGLLVNATLEYDRAGTAEAYETALFVGPYVRGAPPCPGDANGDGTIDFSDLNAVLAQFGQAGVGLVGDIDGDGIVNFSDLNAVLALFGTACPGS